MKNVKKNNEELNQDRTKV